MSIFGQNKILGIDLGSKHIKVVETEKANRNIKLLNYSITSLSWSEQFGRLLDTSQTFEENLGQLLGEVTKDFKTREAIFVLPANLLFSSFFSLPLISEKNLKNAIIYEASKYIPIAADEVAIDWRAFQFQNIYQQESQPRWLIFMVASPKNLIEKFQNASMIAGLKLRKTIPEFLAIEPFLVDTSPKAIVDLGTSYSLFLVFHQNKIIYGKKIQFRAYDLIQSMATMMNVVFDRAEDFLVENGFNLPPEESDLRANIFNFVGNLANELTQSVNEVEERFLINIDTLLLTGGLALAPGFLNLLASKITKFPIALMDPFDKIILPSRVKGVELKRGPVLSQALGACFKYFFDKIK